MYVVQTRLLRGQGCFRLILLESDLSSKKSAKDVCFRSHYHSESSSETHLAGGHDFRASLEVAETKMQSCHSDLRLIIRADREDACGAQQVLLACNNLSDRDECAGSVAMTCARDNEEHQNSDKEEKITARMKALIG